MYIYIYMYIESIVSYMVTTVTSQILGSTLRCTDHTVECRMQFHYHQSSALDFFGGTHYKSVQVSLGSTLDSKTPRREWHRAAQGFDYVIQIRFCELGRLGQLSFIAT